MGKILQLLKPPDVRFQGLAPGPRTAGADSIRGNGEDVIKPERYVDEISREMEREWWMPWGPGWFPRKALEKQKERKDEKIIDKEKGISERAEEEKRTEEVVKEKEKTEEERMEAEGRTEKSLWVSISDKEKDFWVSRCKKSDVVARDMFKRYNGDFEYFARNRKDQKKYIKEWKKIIKER